MGRREGMRRAPLAATLPVLLRGVAAGGGCAGAGDCAYNGACVGGACVCAAAWRGDACEELAVTPADPARGFDSPHDAGAAAARGGVSSWGGSVLKGDDGLYHMWSSEFVEQCGIQFWNINSRVVHATSRDPEGPYRFADVAFDPWAHEPNVVRAPTGEYVMYMTYRHPVGRPIFNCTDTPYPPPNPPLPPPGQCRPAPFPLPRHTYMSWAPKPDGPWSAPVEVLHANTSVWENCTILIDTNMAPVIRKDGSLVGVWRRCDNLASGPCRDKCCTFPHLVTAKDWRDPAAYVAAGPLFDNLQPFGAEDPFVWEAGGVIHALMHDEQGPTRSTARGRHAFSDDGGATWRYAATDAYGGDVATRGGGTLRLQRRERPHLLLGADGSPTHLTNGVVEVGADPPDRSYTLVQPLATAQR